jgi:tRNA (guanine-N7-)-methyltransferase
MRLKSKSWAKPLIAHHPERIQDDILPIIQPDNYAKLALEIGTGKGDFIYGMSLKYPNTYFIGIEKATTVIAFALKKVLTLENTNIKLIHGQFAKASIVMNDAIFDTVYLNFSDPWPKIRHHKRRLTAPGNLDKITRVLKAKAQLVLKTDNEEFFDFSILSIQSKEYNITSIDRCYQLLQTDVMTEYEQYFRERGQPIFRLVAERK